MNQFEGHEVELAFALGYASAIGQSPEEDPRDAAFVSGIFKKAKVAPRQVDVTWTEGGPADIRFLEDGGTSSRLAESCAIAFAQGLVSALLLLEETRAGDPVVQWAASGDENLRGALATLQIPWEGGASRTGVAALDLLGRVLEGAPAALPSVRARFDAWRCRLAYVKTDAHSEQVARVQLVHEAAVLPFKEHVSDSGYDLSLIYEKKRFGRTVLYGTGVVIEPPFGWYFDVVPRSSIIKRGHILANSVGVIDRSYRGEIFVPLIKIDPDAPDLELPARVAQLIPRPIVHFTIAKEESLSMTQRGSGGFGSTGT